MAAEHNIGHIKVQYIKEVDRIKVIPENGTIYWTNSFIVIRNELEKKKQKQLSLF